MKPPYLLSLALWMFAISAQAATYHVAPQGSDAASGSQAAPWASISHAVDQVAAGDTVLVGPGTYPELVTVTRSGTAAAPIRIEADGNVTMEGFRLLGDYLQVAGFRVRTLGCDGEDSYGIEARGTGFVIEDNDIYEMPDGGIQTGAGSSNGLIRGNRLERNVQTGIELHGSGHLVEGNEILHPLERHPVGACNNGGDDANGITFFGSGHVLRGNLIYDIDYSDPDVLDAHADCFQTYGSWIAGEVNADILVEDNICEALTFQNEDENGNGFYVEDVTRLTIRNNFILSYGGLGANDAVVDLVVVNNSFVSAIDIGGNPDTHRGVDIWHQTLVGGMIRNNVFVDFRGGPYYIGSQVQGMAHDHNLAWWSDGSNPVESWWAFQCDGDGNLCADPRLLDPTALDFRVAADSPVIDAGTSNVPVDDDIDGTARPQGSAFDLGAYEQPSGPVPPSAAIGLDIGDGELPLTVHFSDRSGGLPTSWDWAFGDGATSTEQDPSHTYTAAGSFSVTLTVGNDQGSDSTTLATPILVRAPSLDRPLFEDGFETGLAWISSDIAEWYTGTPKIGTHAVQLRRRGAIETSVSTVGYSDIQVHFALGAKSLDKGVEFVVAEWFDGSAWTELVRISDGEEDGQLHEHSFALPAAAANNPSLGLRFVLHGSGGQDYAYIDDVLITGREGQTQPQPPIVYHVSSTGDDANDGSEAAPLRSIQAALDLAQPGDSVMVQSGTYNETLVFPRSGAADAWITLQAQPGHAVTIDATGIPIADYWQGAITIADVAYIRVQDLRVEHSARTGIIANRASHVEILDNQTYDTVLSGIGVWRSDNVQVDGNRVELAVNGGEQECISVSISSNVAVTNNEVLNDGAGTAGGEGIDIKDGSSQVVVRGNHVHDLDELGIYVDAWDSDTSDILIADNRVYRCNNHGIAIAAERGGRVDRVTIRNNLTYANARMGITIGDWDSGWPHPMADILIVNNTSVDNGPGAVWGAGIAVLNAEAMGVTIRNNLVANNAYAQILDESGGAEITADHNLIWGASGSGDDITGSDAVLADPRLVDAANADYRPRFDSPAIDAANDLDAPTTDLDGMARPTGIGIDIGAYEYQPGPVPPRAALSVDRTSGEAPLTVQFTDGSVGEPTTWLWSFGDGTTSTEQHPEHSYSAPGGFDVTLTVTNDQGSDSLTEFGLITVTAPGTGIALIDDGFEFGLDWVTSGDVALYTGTPNHDGTALQLLQQGMAEMAVSTEGLGQLQLAFALGAKSLDNVGEYLVMEWWDGAQWQEAARIDDGSANENGQLNPYQMALPTSAEDNPDFKLRVRLNGSGLKDYGYLDDILLRAEPLGPPVAPVALFEASPLSGPAPLQVALADLSDGHPTGWLWDFGDGATSTEQHPVHDYLLPGTYDLTLTVTNSVGGDTLVMPALISIDAPLPDQEILLEDFSAGLGAWYTERNIQVVNGVATLTGNNVWANRGIPTTGFDAIRVDVDLGAAGYEAGESLILYWKDGGNWQQLHAVRNGSAEADGQLHHLTFDLPASAADNPSFGIALGQWGADSGDVGQVDNLRISGTPR